MAGVAFRRIAAECFLLVPLRWAARDAGLLQVVVEAVAAVAGAGPGRGPACTLTRRRTDVDLGGAREEKVSAPESPGTCHVSMQCHLLPQGRNGDLFVHPSLLQLAQTYIYPLLMPNKQG